MDLLGPFPTSNLRTKCIVVATDYFTRYAETRGLPKSSAVKVAKFFIENIVLRHGAPEFLITDRDTAFTADLTQTILRYSEKSHRRTTAYHPQTNGLTERLNKTIANMLAMYDDVEQMTPYKLVYGMNQATTLSPVLPNVSDEVNIDLTVYFQSAEEARQLTCLCIKNQQMNDSCC